MELVIKCADWVMPLILLCVGAIFWHKPEAWEAYVRGARQGLSASVTVLPAMVLLLVSLSVFTSSGACDRIAAWIAPVTERCGIPGELVPLCLLRPLSGSASGAYVSALLDEVGPDSVTGMAASILTASGDTVVYVLGMYFSVTRVRRTRYALPVSLTAGLLSVFLSCVLARIFV